MLKDVLDAGYSNSISYKYVDAKGKFYEEGNSKTGKGNKKNTHKQFYSST